MKKLIITLGLISLYSGIFAQNEVTYEIQRNKPDSINNLMAYVSPLSWDFSKTHFSFGFAAGAYYNYQDRFTLEYGFRRSFSEKLNIFKFDEEHIDYSGTVNYGKTSGDIKNMVVSEFTGQYIIGGNTKKRTMSVTLKSILNQYTIYTKIKVKRYYAFPIRFGFSYYQSNISTQWANSNNFLFQGFDINLPSDSIESIEGSTMYYAQTINFGLAFYQKDDLRVKFTGAYNGIKDFSSISFYYIDILFPIYQNLQNMNVYEKDYSYANLTSNISEYNVDKHTPMSPFGLKAGLKWSNLQKINVSGYAEIGYKPGPIDFNTNFYIFMGLNLNISKITKHY